MPGACHWALEKMSSKQHIPTISQKQQRIWSDMQAPSHMCFCTLCFPDSVLVISLYKTSHGYIPSPYYHQFLIQNP